MNNEVNAKANRKRSLLERFLLLIPLGDGTVEEALLIWLMISVWVHYVVSAAMMIILLVTVLLIPKTRQRVLSEPKMFFLGLLIAEFSFLVSVIAKNLIGMAISFGVFMIITLGCFAKSVMTEARFEKLQVIGCIGSIISCLIAFYQNFIKYGDNPAYRPTSVAFNANYYGALIVMTEIICIYNILDGKKPEGKRNWYNPHKLFFVAVLLLNCVALLMGESRSSLLALMVCAVFYLFITKRYVLFIIAVCIAAGVGTLGWFYPDVLSWTNSLAYSFTERSTIWKEALKSFSQSPYTVILGRGPMTYYLVMEKEGLFVANHAHNILVDTLLNVGIIGTAMYIILFAYFTKEIFRAGKKGNQRAFVIGILFILEILVQGIADVTIMWHQSAMLFMLMLSTVGPEKTKE